MRIGLIGYGNMGSAIADRVKKKYPVVIFDNDASKISGARGLEVAAGLVDLANRCDIIILAIKPQDFDDVLQELSGLARDKLVISIAAGTSTKRIEKVLQGARVVRSMPNLPARVGAGMICLVKGKNASEADLNFSKELFRVLGEVQVLDDEAMLDAATAVSGSGPGFFFKKVEGYSTDEIKKYADTSFVFDLADSAQKVGFTPEQAMLLAKATTDGSVEFLQATGLKPEDAKKLVASKKGTTEAGLEELQQGHSLEDAVKAALTRARELSRD